MVGGGFHCVFRRFCRALQASYKSCKESGFMMVRFSGVSWLMGVKGRPIPANYPRLYRKYALRRTIRLKDSHKRQSGGPVKSNRKRQREVSFCFTA